MICTQQSYPNLRERAFDILEHGRRRDAASRASGASGQYLRNVMNNNGEREARLGRSLKRLDHRLVTQSNGGFGIADESGQVLAKSLTLDEVEAWIKKYLRTTPTRKT